MNFRLNEKNIYSDKTTLLLRLKAETLMLLCQFNIIDDYALYDDICDKKNNEKYFDKIDFINSNKNIITEKKLTKIDLTTYTNNNTNYNYQINYFKTKMYIIKVNLSKREEKYILNKFDSIEKLDINEYVF